jgi:hypothetical protein
MNENVRGATPYILPIVKSGVKLIFNKLLEKKDRDKKEKLDGALSLRPPTTFESILMAKYVVHYEMRKGPSSAQFSHHVECESERTAIQIAEAKGRRDRPGYDFGLKRVERH